MVNGEPIVPATKDTKVSPVAPAKTSEAVAGDNKAQSASYFKLERVTLYRAWQFLFFCGVMMATFGAMMENWRLSICGYYVIFELTCEMVDAGMSWMERR